MVFVLFVAVNIAHDHWYFKIRSIKMAVIVLTILVITAIVVVM